MDKFFVFVIFLETWYLTLSDNTGGLIGWGDGFCDNGSDGTANLNCAQFFFDYGDCCMTSCQQMAQWYCESGDEGYNIKTGEYVNMVEEGIIDPTKVTRTALENAVSVAGTMLITECTVVDNPEDKNENVQVPMY